jgi:flagellar motility protein MotE (MotC chaperone)
MKSLWLIVSTLAIANLLAIGGLVLWLRSSERLNMDRMRQIREVLAPTLSEQAQANVAAETAKQEETKRQEAEVKAALPPVPAADRLNDQREETERQMQVTLRQQQELASLRSALMNQLRSLEEREKKLSDERAAFEGERARIAEIEGTRQFKTALATLEAQKPRDAASVLRTMLASKQTDQVVAYLARMDDRRRGSILTEFGKTDPGVAADLLERIRTRGLTPSAPTASTEVRPTDDDRTAASGRP